MSKHINTIALDLSSDVYGANGDLSPREIRARLIANIRQQTDHWTDSIPIHVVADLLLSMWTYMNDRDNEAIAELCKGFKQLPPDPTIG